MAHTRTSHAGVRAALVSLAFASPASAQTVWFVDDDAAPDGDGLAWATAFDDLQTATEIAAPGDTIWLAQGTYTPSVIDPIAGVDRPYFIMPDGVAILGGFTGTETDETQREPAANETIISGDLLGNDITDVVIDRPADDDPDRLGPVLDSKLDNADLLFFVDRTGPGTRLDGLTLTGVLKQDQTPFGPASRGSIFVIGGELEIVDCLITGNLGGANAGIYAIDCGYEGIVDDRFASHPCVGDSSLATPSRVLVDRCRLIDNPSAFTDRPVFSATTVVFSNNSLLAVRDSVVEQSTDPTASTTDAFFGSATIAGAGSSGSVVIERSVIRNAGALGALNVNQNVTGTGGLFLASVDVTIRALVVRDVRDALAVVSIRNGSFAPSHIWIDGLEMVNNEVRTSSSAVLDVSLGSGSHASITNAAFVGNVSFVTSRVRASTASVANATFAGNVRTNSGASSAISSTPISVSSPADIRGLVVDSAATLDDQVTESIVPGFADPSRNILGLDPLFVRRPSDGGDGWGDDPTTPDIDESLNDDFGDLRLRANSPAIDRADASLLDPGATDLDGTPRVVDDAGIPNAPGLTLDYGAYEFRGTSCLPDINADGALDGTDFLAWVDAFNDGGAIADTNRDGRITPADFFAWVAAFGVGCP